MAIEEGLRVPSPAGEAAGRYLAELELVDLSSGAGGGVSIAEIAADIAEFFSAVGKAPCEVTIADVVGFMAQQRARACAAAPLGREPGEQGQLAPADQVARQLASVSGLFAYLVAKQEPGILANPVPPSFAPGAAPAPFYKGPERRAGQRGPRLPPLAPAEVLSLRRSLRTHRDRAMVEAMLLGALRRHEVLGLRLADVDEGGRWVTIGTGSQRRTVPMSPSFVAHLGAYLAQERCAVVAATDLVFVVLSGDRAGHPLSAARLDRTVRAARRHAGLGPVTCRHLRHTCLARLREAGMGTLALQAMAGHRLPDPSELTREQLGESHARAVARIEETGWRP